MGNEPLPAPNDTSPDSEDRIADFLSRHGGSSRKKPQQATLDAGQSGWSEVYAMDGYTLRCEWSRAGTRLEMQFVEIPGVE